MLENKINAWLVNIHPKIEIKKNINLSFVPVYTNIKKKKLISYSGH